jgi:hypothetical protein
MQGQAARLSGLLSWRIKAGITEALADRAARDSSSSLNQPNERLAVSPLIRRQFGAEAAALSNVESPVA